MAIGSALLGQRRDDDLLTRITPVVAVGAFTVAFAGALAIVVQRVPVVAPRLSGGERMAHWPFAFVAVGVVVAVDALAMAAVRRRPSRARAEHNGWYRALVLLGLLQVGHLAEHTIQVGQLLATSGSLDRSHGLVGRLDFETVHFVWDSAVWLLLAVLLSRFTHNRWLWVSFVAASVHEVEHLYLFYVYLMHKGFYFDGGFAGIMGRNGLIGTPLFRPYLHFAYNVLVVVPLVVAVWFEARSRGFWAGLRSAVR